MTSVRLTAEHSGYGKFHVWLVSGDGPVGAVHPATDAVVPRSVVHGQLSTSGVVLVDLTPTADLVPAGMVYRADFRKTGSSVPEQLYFAGFTGAGPVDATDYEVDPPGDLTIIYDGGNAGTIASIEDGGGAVAA